MKFGRKEFFAISLLAISLLATLPFAAHSAAVSGTLSGPDGILPGEDGQFYLELTPDGAGQKFDIAVLVPSGWTIGSWNAPGYQKSGITLEKRSRSYKGLSYEAYHWKFSEKMSLPKTTFSFSLTVPRTASLGTVREISSIWTTPENFGTRNMNITVGAATKSCGDGSCSGEETCSSCPVDCGMCWEASCGDSVCSPGESYSTCPKDCSVQTTTTKPSSGWEIIITPETGSFLGTVGLAAGAILLLGLLILLIVLVVRGSKAGPPQPSPLEEARKEIKSPLAKEREDALKTAASLGLTETSNATLRDQVKGNFEIKPVERKPLKAKVERPVETTEKKISLLKKAMLRIENIMDDIGKDL